MFIRFASIFCDEFMTFLGLSGMASWYFSYKDYFFFKVIAKTRPQRTIPHSVKWISM